MNRWINVLIVDDEVYVREGLRQILDWEKYGFTICDEAGTGQEALEKIQLYQPGLVLLDIKMPGMSGIELIRTAREEGFQGEMIVLSGYSDFEYAQAAIHYGVGNYIVKPIDEGELTAAIVAVKEKIDTKQMRELSMSQYRKKAKSMVLHDILNGREFDPYINYRELKLDASVYQVIIYENYLPHLQLTRFADLLLLGDNEEDHLEQIKQQNRNIILLKNRHALEHFQNWIAHYDRGFQKGSFMDSVFFVYGEEVFDIREIHRSYQQCLTLIERKFFCDKYQRMLSFRDIPKEECATEIDESVGKEYSEKLVGYIQTHNRRKISQALEELKNFLAQNNFRILAVRHLLIDILLEVKHQIIRIYGSGVEIPFQKNATVIEVIENKFSMYEIFEYLTEQFEMIMSYVGNETSDNVFKEILCYVDNNYSASLKLEQIGPMFGYSSAYLGKLFSLKKGCSFKTYLDQIRVEKSQKLLLETDMKIYEVAAKVGYKYVDAFHQKFKKVTNLSPAEYRKQMTGREFE